MPKRRITAKQKLASKRNLIAARAARHRVVGNHIWKTGLKPYPTGKKTYLYHRTTPDRADVIVKSKKWISGTTAHGGLRGRSWFSTGSPVKPASAYSANAIVGVAVPRQAVRRELYDAESRYFVSVANKDLRGRKVKRLV